MEVLETFLNSWFDSWSSPGPEREVTCLELAMGIAEEEAQGVSGIISRANAKPADLYLKNRQRSLSQMKIWGRCSPDISCAMTSCRYPTTVTLPISSTPCFSSYENTTHLLVPTNFEAQLAIYQFKNFTRDANGCTLGPKAQNDGYCHLSGFISIIFSPTFSVFPFWDENQW